MSLMPELESQLLAAAERQALPRRRFRGRRAGLALAAGAVLVAGTAAAVVGSHDSSDPNIRPYLEILRRPITPADALRSPGGYSQQHTRASEARRVHVLVPGWKAWVLPRKPDGAACLAVQPPEATGPAVNACFEEDSIRRGASPATGTVQGGGYVVQGIVPDGVPAIILRRRDGSVRRTPVRDNVYIGLSDKQTVSVTYDGPDGRTSVRAWSPGYTPPPPRPTAAERAQSERARQHPSRHVRVSVLAQRPPPGARRNVGPLNFDFSVMFRARVDYGTYAFRLRGPGGRACADRLDLIVRTERAPRSRRGRVYSAQLSPPDGRGQATVSDAGSKARWCPGRYRVDASLVDRGRRFSPFGTAYFVAR